LESRLVYLLARMVIGFFRVIPRRTAVAVLDLLGALAWRLDRRHRKIALVNLRIAFPDLSDPERSAIGRRSFQNAAQNVLEVSRLRTLDSGNIDRIATYHPESGINNFEAARARGRPILYITGHFGAWELLPAAHALNGHPLSFITRPLDNPFLDRFLNERRTTGGNEVISKRRATRRVLEALKDGRDVGILMDQTTQVHEGVFVDLFGLPASTTPSVALLALRTDATVLPGFIVPRGRGKYWLKFLPPVDLVRTGRLEDDIRLNTASFNRIIEQFIHAHPDTWLWGHKRWKYQPAGNPQDLYSLSPIALERFLAAKDAIAAEPVGAASARSRNTTPQ
jgi:Kdo2-lipid IVA lauroyltransferase/acyltransferase